jgi:hypothetical protein
VCLEALAAGARVISFCKPMKAGILHWHVAENMQELPQKIKQLLNDNRNYQSVIPFDMDDSARQMMELFCQPAANIKELV